MSDRGRGRFLPFMLGWALAGLAALFALYALLALLLAEPWSAFAFAGLLSAVPVWPLLRLGQARSGRIP